MRWIKQTVGLRPGLRLHDSQVEFVEEVFDEKVVRIEHLHRTLLMRMVRKNAFQIRCNITANPVRLKHRAGLHHVHCAVRFDEEIGHGLPQRLADDEPLSASFAQGQITCKCKLLSSGGEDRAMGHERIGGEMWFKCARITRGGRRATGYQQGGERQEQRGPAQVLGNSKEGGQTPAKRHNKLRPASNRLFDNRNIDWFVLIEGAGGKFCIAMFLTKKNPSQIAIGFVHDHFARGREFWSHMNFQR